MGSEWPTVALGELSNITSSKRIFASDYCTSGVPFYRSKEIIEKANGGSISTELFISHDKFNGIKQKFGAPEENDILLTSVGTLGVPYLVKAKEEFYFKDGNLTWLQTSTSEVCARFIYIWLRSCIAKRAIDEVTIGSTQQALTIAALKSLKISLPPLTEQHAIAHILGSLDDKIELNRRMNATLEGMAQALFKSWFVDFDPVIDNALAAGNPIPEELADRAEVRRAALADGTANREAAKPFPAGFQHTEELGWIPAGWEATPISKLLKTISETFPLKSVSEVVFLNTGDILNGRFLHNDLSSTTGLPGQAKKSIRQGDILYSEIRPKNKRHAFVYFDSPNHVVSTKLMVLRAIDSVSALFSYFILKQESVIAHLQMLAESRSGTFPQITFDVLSKLQTALPTDSGIVDVFTESVLEPTFQKQLDNDGASETLIKLRDTLLPKLISGELRIPDAEKLAEEALV